ncbi:MAG: TetR/AcrR family transcriptional regulator [Ktedonobacterales bacterium]|nr:TetR/AcrR family transcriptional regulator [Ktedonobacterales bacterium]
MSEPPKPPTTPKAVATRARIRDAAFRLLAEKGYEGTTMREIADTAQTSLGLTYRYFPSKDAIILELYGQFQGDLAHIVADLPPTTIAERFFTAMVKLLEMMAPYRATLGGLFSVSLNPRSGAGVFGESVAQVRHEARAVFSDLVRGARDAPKDAPMRDDLATLLYGMQLAMVLFWLQDHAADHARTTALLTWVRDALAAARPALGLPPVRKMLLRLAGIVGPLLGA